MIGGMSDLAILEWDPPAECRDCHHELGGCSCLQDPPDLV